MNAGVAALALLSVLNRANGAMYGYQIARLIEKGNEGMPMIKQGTLYPVLRSLENNGLLESEVEPSVSGPPRRYYKITESGRSAFERWTAIWNSTQQFMNTHLKEDYNGR